MLSFISRDDFDALCPSLEHIELKERYVLEQPHEKIELVSSIVASIFSRLAHTASQASTSSRNLTTISAGSYGFAIKIARIGS